MPPWIVDQRILGFDTRALSENSTYVGALLNGVDPSVAWRIRDWSEEDKNWRRGRGTTGRSEQEKS